MRVNKTVKRNGLSPLTIKVIAAALIGG